MATANEEPQQDEPVAKKAPKSLHLSFHFGKESAGTVNLSFNVNS